MNTAIIRATVTAPGADTNVYVLFATIAVSGTGSSYSDPGWAPGHMAANGYKRLVVDLKHNAALTLNWYKSSNRGSTWHQLDTEAIAAPAATETTLRTFLVEQYDDFKIEAVNGGSAQTTWVLNVALSPERGT